MKLSSKFTLITLAGLSAFAQANPIISSIGATAQTAGGTNVGTPVNGVSDSYVNASSNQYPFSASAGSYATTSYYAAASASVYGAGNSQSGLVISQNVQNNTGVAQRYTFDFQIYRGGGGINVFYPLQDGDFSEWGYSLNILVGSASSYTNLFASGVTIRAEQMAGALSSTSTSIGGHQAFDGVQQSSSATGLFYNWGVTNRSVQFNLAAGASTSIIYDMQAFASGLSAVYSLGNNCGENGTIGYGEELASALSDGPINCDAYRLYSYGTTRDPGELTSASFSTLSSTPLPSSDVPLPGALALVALGLGIVPLTSRRRKA